MAGFVEDEKNYENFVPCKQSLTQNTSPRSPLSPNSPQSDSIDLAINRVVDTSIEQLYYNVCEMESSDQSPSRASFLSYGQESRIDSELCHLVGATFREIEVMKDEENSYKDYKSSQNMSIEGNKILNLAKKMTISSKKEKPSPKNNISQKNSKNISKKKKIRFFLGGSKLKNGNEDPIDLGLDNKDLGPFLLKKARDLISSGDNPQKALELALRARNLFEKCEFEKPNLDLVMCLHVLAAVYIKLGQYNDAIPVLEKSIEIPIMEHGQEHALAKFAGCMQLGDTYEILGQIENSILCYNAGLEIQKQALGKTDPRIGETYRYVSEAYVQALQFDEAQKLCQMALDIHREHGSPASLEEAADRKLMGLICAAKGDYENALEHYVLAGMTMASNGHDTDVAYIDCSIGDTYLSLSRYDEAVFAYRKALTSLKSTKGENHPTVAMVYVRLGDLSNKIGKFRESKTYCGNALRIYGKSKPGIFSEEIARGLINVSAIFESMNELDRGLKLLQKAMIIYSKNNTQGKQIMIGGIEAQIGVLYYMMGNYDLSYNSFKNAVFKLRAMGEMKCAMIGIVLNQMGLACVQRFAISEAKELFEEARSILESECGPYDPDTLGVYSNLAGTYDALGRVDDAIEILEYVVGMREEKLGTANPEVDDEKRRLEELLKEAGRVRGHKSRPLGALLDSHSKAITKQL